MADQPEDRDDKALALARPLPTTKVARNLQVASSREFVYVDRKGRVQSPARLRAMQVTSYGVMAGLLGGATAFYYATIGPAGIAVGGVLALWFARVIGASFTLRDGLRLMVADRFDEAAVVFTRIARGRFVPRRLRANAEQNLGTCRMIAGQHEEALALYRSAIVRWGSSNGLRVAMARGSEICALVNLGRLTEARAHLGALGPMPAGEYLRIHRWTVELYLALAEGHHEFPEEELYRRSRAALAITTAAALLGLLAWAYDQSGDQDMSRHLLDECLDRHFGLRISGTLPLLQRWLDQARASAG
jgi:tetratricopeptide (TPR) repeat protein